MLRNKNYTHLYKSLSDVIVSFPAFWLRLFLTYMGKWFGRMENVSGLN